VSYDYMQVKEEEVTAHAGSGHRVVSRYVRESGHVEAQACPLGAGPDLPS
jgi:hypothetical protein